MDMDSKNARRAPAPQLFVGKRSRDEMSCGHGESAQMQFCSASSTMRSPARLGGSTTPVRPSAVTGLFWNRLNGSGTSRLSRPWRFSASRMFSRQLRWPHTPKSTSQRDGSQAGTV
jgi:hypothetical protein